MTRHCPTSISRGHSYQVAFCCKKSIEGARGGHFRAGVSEVGAVGGETALAPQVGKPFLCKCPPTPVLRLAQPSAAWLQNWR